MPDRRAPSLVVPPTIHDNLRVLLGSLSIRHNRDQIDVLARYLFELRLWNRRFRLIADASESALMLHLRDVLQALPIINHTLTKLAHPNPHIRSSGRPLPSSIRKVALADVGSGNGMPGIPLAILLPDIEMTLIERSERRANFLRGVVVQTSSGARVLQCDIQDAHRRFDAIVSRAFKPLDANWTPSLVNLLKPGGVLIAYKGTRENAEIEADLARQWFATVTLTALAPIDDAERHLIIARRAQ